MQCKGPQGWHIGATLCVLLVAAAACGGASDDAATQGLGPDDWEESWSVIAECIENAGYDPMQESPDVLAVEDPVYSETLDTCYAEGGLEVRDFEVSHQKMEAHLQLMYECLVLQGWDISYEQSSGVGSLPIMDSSRISDDESEAYITDSGQCAQDAAVAVEEEFEGE